MSSFVSSEQHQTFVLESQNQMAFSATLAHRALEEAAATIKRLESIRDELVKEITRKSLYIQHHTEPDLSDIPPYQRLIVPADVLDLSDENLTSLEWVGTAGLKIALIAGLEHLKFLESVSFRSGFIRKPTGLEHCHETMKVLELYENRLRTLEGVQTLTHLETLDVSYNRLGKLENMFLSPLTNLTKLYVAENKLSEIDPNALLPLVHLKVLDLGGNNIRKIQGLDTLVNLKELWLGKNKITKIEGLENLKSLVRLSIQSNRITKVENLNHLVTLEELYLSDQGIEQIEGIDHLQNLTTLDFTNNKIKSLDGFPNFAQLTDLWLAANQISDFEEIEKFAPLLSDCIDTLVFERNPVAQIPDYRKRVFKLFPSLSYIDADPVTRL